MGLRIDPPLRIEPGDVGGESSIERAIRDSRGERGGFRVIRPDLGIPASHPSTGGGPQEDIDVIIDFPHVGRAMPTPPALVQPGPMPGAIQSVQARDWIEYWDLKGKGVLSVLPPLPRVPAPVTQPAVVVAPSPLIEDEEQGMAHFVEGLGDLALDVIREQVLPQQPMIAPAQLLAPGTVGPSLDTSQLYNPATGKFYTKKRRRRRRLATQSDICDLTALKAILSPAEFKTWIACAKR